MHLEGCIHSVHLEQWIHGVHFRGKDTQYAFEGMDTLCTFGVSVNFRGVDTIHSVHFSLEGWIHSVNCRRTLGGVDVQCACRGMNTQCTFGVVDTQCAF